MVYYMTPSDRSIIEYHLRPIEHQLNQLAKVVDDLARLVNVLSILTSSHMPEEMRDPWDESMKAIREKLQQHW
jgi:type VI protein secretion system component VasF